MRFCVESTSVSMCVRVRVYVSVWWRSRVDGVWFVMSGAWSMVCCEGVCACARCVVRCVVCGGAWIYNHVSVRAQPELQSEHNLSLVFTQNMEGWVSTKTHAMNKESKIFSGDTICVGKT